MSARWCAHRRLPIEVRNAVPSALVIVNPVSGPLAQRVLDRDRLARALREVGLDGTWHETTVERDAGAIVREHPGDDPVIIVGGDGTVQSGARALRGGDRPLLVVPRGTGNVFAQNLGIPARLNRALRLLQQGELRRVDVGALGAEPFLLGAGIGLDARVIRRADRQLKTQMGKLAYVVGAASTLPVRHHEFEIDIEGRTLRERAAAVHVANFGTRVGPWVLPPSADGSDGLLEVVILKAESLEQTLGLLATPILPSGAPNKGVVLHRVREVRVRADEALPVQVDGEDRGDHVELHCRVEPASLPVLVPKS